MANSPMREIMQCEYAYTYISLQMPDERRARLTVDGSLCLLSQSALKAVVDTVTLYKCPL